MMHRGLKRIASDEAERGNKLCQLNVIEQVVNVCRLPVMQDAWTRSQDVTVHGWVYGLQDGRLRDLGLGVRERQRTESLRRRAVGLPHRMHGFAGMVLLAIHYSRRHDCSPIVPITRPIS